MIRRQFIKGSAILGASIVTPGLATNSGLLQFKSTRKVRQIITADSELVGTLPILRAFAGNHLDYVSPYVLFDEFGPVDMKPGQDPLRVDAHPHAGIIPTTYFLSGSGHHKDSLNYDFQISKGDFMYFSSGKGAIHMEETGKSLHEDGGNYHGFQIWLNMPAAYKYTDPSTKVFREKSMPFIVKENFTGRVILGELNGFRSEVELLSPAFYYHIQLNPDRKLTIPTDPTHNAFIYVIRGELELESNKLIKANQIALFERNASELEMYSECGTELLVLGGQPLNEPVYSYGPFVMNSREQINKCIMDYRTGKMGDPRLVN